MLNTNSAIGQRMHRDPRDPQVIETSDSTARARDYQRHERAKILNLAIAISDIAWFDREFRGFYAEDREIFLFLSDAAAKRGLDLIQPLEVQ